MSSWINQFGAGAILESTDGATYNEIKPIIDPQAPKEEEVIQFNTPTLAEQLAARKAEEDEEYRELHRNKPPKPLDEDEASFLEAIANEEQIKEDLRRKQEQKDIQSFNKAVQNRIIKLNDQHKIIPIDMQINKQILSKNNKSKNIIIAPNVHNNNKSNLDLDGIVVLKKKKKIKKKKKKKTNKKRKLNDSIKQLKDNNSIKRRKLNVNEQHDNNKNKLSEWERE
eukprot:318809_1